MRVTLYISMTLAHDIAQWDSKGATHIKRVYASHYEHPYFHESLIALFPSIEHQDGATWLLKHAIDEGDLVPEAIDPKLFKTMFASLDALERWPAQLHALQILSVISIPDANAKQVETFAHQCMSSPKTFVRAWSYTVLFKATQHDPKKHTKAIQQLNDTLDDGKTPASVKARIRNTLKS